MVLDLRVILPSPFFPLRSLAWVILKAFLHNKFPEVKQLSTADLATWLEKTETSPPLLLDVRTSAEFAVSHLCQARLAPSDPQQLQHWQDVTAATPIVVYCSVGYRSSRFAHQLQTLGYQTVFNLEGSIFQWANEGRLLCQNETTVSQVHPYDQLWGLLLK